MIIILDIDETLIHSVHMNDSNIDEDDEDDITTLNNSFVIDDYRVFKRPQLDIFINNLLNDDYYELGVWSAGTYDYVHSIVDNIFPDKSKLKFIMTRNDCNEQRDKPLTKVRDLVNKIDKDKYPFQYTTHDFLLIDDRENVTGGFDELNHLQIIPFEGNTIDEELPHLWHYLDKNRYYSSEYLVVNYK